MAVTSFAIAPAVGLSTGWFMTGLTALSFIPMPTGVAMMAIQKEIWINDIVANLFKANPHLNFAYNADAFVLSGKVVHIPNSGTKPAVKKNRTDLPATVVTRTDTDITFSLDEFSSDPMKISNAEKYELSYDKRQSVIGDQKESLAETVGDWFFSYWAPLAAKCKRTTGANIAAHVGTGNRKAVTLADIKQFDKLFNRQNVAKTDRYCQLDADMYEQFTDSLTATQYRDFSSAFNPETGVVGKLFGFTFLASRSTVLVYDDGDDLLLVDASVDVTAEDYADAATACAAGLFWQKDCVIRALGQNEMFEDIANPQYYGDIYSALIRAGGRIRRNDAKGVMALIQDIPAAG